MPESVQRVRVEEVDWRGALPFLQLFRCFRMAIHPSKLFTAWALVVALLLLGWLLDAVGPTASVHELEAFRTLPAEEFREWRDRPRGVQETGVFAAALAHELRAFQRLIQAALSLDLGWSELGTGGGLRRNSVLGALFDMAVLIPLWIARAHPVFALTYGLFGWALWALLGGAIARMAALHATRDQRLGPIAALRFAARNFFSFVGAHLLPALVALLLALAMAAIGFLFFGIPYLHVVLDFVGALLFGLLLALGFALAALLIGLAMAMWMLYPPVAVDRADGFDANSRAFNYVAGRPWHWLFYNLVALIYGAITYILVGLVLLLAVGATRWCVGLGADLIFGWGYAPDRFDAVLPADDLTLWPNAADAERLGGAGTAAASVVRTWTWFFLLLLPAYAISYYFCSQTMIYLLLRRSADGTELDEAAVEETPPPPAPEKVEPAPPA